MKPLSNLRGRMVLPGLLLMLPALVSGCQKSSDELYGSGTRALRRGEIETAFDRFLAAVEVNPEDVESNLELGKIYLLVRRNRDKAEDHFEQALKLRPSDAEGRFYLAQICYETDRREEARTHFTAVMQGIASEQMRTRATEYLRKIALDNRAEQNLVDMEAALVERPDDQELILKLAKACRAVGMDYLIHRNNRPRAEELMARFRELNDALIDTLREVHAANPRDAETAHLLGERLYDAGEERLLFQNLSDAADRFREAMETDPENGKYYFALANVYAKRLQDEPGTEATEADIGYLLSEAVRQAPDVPRYRLTLAGYHLENGNKEQGERELKTLIETFPPETEEVLRAQQYLQQIELQEASAN